MSLAYLGTADALIDSTVNFDPKYGFQREEVWRGIDSAIEARNQAAVLAGIRTAKTLLDGVATLHMFYAIQDPTTGVEVPSDFWELEEEYVQESIWTNKKLLKLALPTGSVDRTIAINTLARWRREIENAQRGILLAADGTIASGSSKSAQWLPEELVGEGWSGTQIELYRQIIMDLVAHETTRAVLVRVRNISNAYTPRAVVQVTPTAFYTPTLISSFAIPSGIAADLPADPSVEDTPIHTAWAWKERRNSRKYQWSGRVEEQRSWTFAAWSTLTHDFI